MDAYLAVVSKREVRRYLPRPIPEDVMTQILEAGRASGSSRNRQPSRFVVITDKAGLQRVALVSIPANVTGAAAAIAVVLLNPRAQFDAGRTAQNMMLAAWALGVGSCPNTPTDEVAIKAVLGLPPDSSIPTIISLGYPAPGERRPRERADPKGVLARIKRLPLNDIVHRERFQAS